MSPPLTPAQRRDMARSGMAPAGEMADLLRIIAAIRAMRPSSVVRVFLCDDSTDGTHWVACLYSPSVVESEYGHVMDMNGQSPAEALRAVHAEVRAAAQAKVLEAARLLAAGDLPTGTAGSR